MLLYIRGKALNEIEESLKDLFWKRFSFWEIQSGREMSTFISICKSRSVEISI